MISLGLSYRQQQTDDGAYVHRLDPPLHDLALDASVLATYALERGMTPAPDGADAARTDVPSTNDLPAIIKQVPAAQLAWV